MDAVLFNFHDMILFMMAMLSVMLACLLFIFHETDKRISSYLLGSFLLLYAIIPLDKMITYGAEFHSVALNASRNIFFFGNAAMLLEGALLFLYVQSLTKKGFQLQRKHLLHLIPLVIYAIYAYILYYQYDDLTKYRLIVSLEIFNHWSFKYFYLIRDSVRIGYGIAGIYALFEYQAVIRGKFSEIQRIDMQWLVSIVVGFLLYRAWMFIESLYSCVFLIAHGDSTPQYIHIMNMSGLLSGYVACLLIITLVFFGLRYSLILEGVDYVLSTGNENRSMNLDWRTAKKLSDYMEEKKPYLEHNITIDELSHKMSIPTKTLSLLLNRHFGKNFFEYINSYRVEAAKQMLSSKNAKSIVDIMYESGFSSKSSFNDCFKRIVGVTPREYRKKYPNDHTMDGLEEDQIQKQPAAEHEPDGKQEEKEEENKLRFQQ
jgi:AraC-like DNA-binding protein